MSDFWFSADSRLATADRPRGPVDWNRPGFAVLPRLALQGPGPKGASRRIAILGGGITGLAAAYTLARARGQGAPIEELLIERGDRLGGTILTEQVEGFLVEAGPDSFLAEKPEAPSLCR